jgi:flagellar hook-associated protein FlgK
VATELNLKAGAIAGYQDAQHNAIDKYRNSLNSLVTDFVQEVNKIYNPTDEPGGYLFGFDAFLSRPVRGANTFIEETYGLFGKEGNGELKVFDEEVNMTVPYAESETFTIVQSSNILPKELEQGWDLEESGIAWFRDGDNFGLQIDQVGVQSNFYASARRMQHATIDYDPSYPGEDKILTPSNPDNDDGRFLLRGYESIPFRIENGSEMYVQGDNFSFDAVLSNEWNLASALRIDDNLSIDNVKSSELLPEGANDIAFEISKLSDGDFTDAISVMNADLGNEMGDLSDNLEHQKSLENLLLDQRRAVSSVSIDEEVADLMQFQRSFQASSRVLNTLDRMLELVVMGLIK